MIEDATGVPLENVQVTLSGATSSEGDTHRSAVTTGSGSFVFPDLPAGTYHVGAQAAGFSNGMQDVTVDGSRPIAALIRLTALASVEVRLLDARGRPADGTVAWSGGARGGLLMRAPDGVFRGDVSAGMVLVTGRAEGYPEARSERNLARGERATIDLSLVAGTVAVVTVRDESGGAVAGASVSINTARATTGQDGVATIDQVGPGLTVAMVRAQGFQTGMQPCQFKEGERADVTVTLKRMGAISGRVVDRSGQGVPAVIVAALDPSTSTERARATSDAQGEFKLVDFSGDIGPMLEVKIVAPETLATSGRGTIVMPGAVGQPLVLLAGSRPRLALRLVPPAGMALPTDAELHGIQTSTGRAGRLAAGAIAGDGGASFELDVGTYDLVVRAGSFAPGMLGPVDLSAGHADPPVREVGLVPGARVSGIVLKGTSPVAGARVAGRFPSSSALSQIPLAVSVTDTGGRFELGGLPAPATITVELPGSPERRVDVPDLSPGGTKTVEIDVE